MRNLWTIVALAASLPMPGEAYAQTAILDGNSLYETCKKVDTAAELYCNAYIRGIYESVTIRATALPWNGEAYCVRSTVTYAQVRDIVVSYLSERPKERDGFAFALVERAIYDAFPKCSADSAGR